MMFIDESWTLDSDPEKATGELRKKKTWVYNPVDVN
jgi:hypothetical protein